MKGSATTKKIRKTLKKTEIFVVVGPTAVGKSSYAVELALQHGKRAEIISADSRQVYTGLDIGTGKITRREMKGVPHHLLDVANPRRQFNAEEYRLLAEDALDGIIARGNTPIIVGGTGFYIDTLMNSIMGGQILPEVKADPKLRKKLADKTAPQLFKILQKLDPRRAKIVSKNNSEMHNRQRLIRSIEIATALGRVPLLKKTQKKAQGQRSKKYNITWIGLNAPSETLRDRIHDRLLKRIKAGMIDEVEQLHKNAGLSWKRMEELGLEYRYISRHLRGQLGYATRAELIAVLESEIWQYARRQMSWFRKNKKIKWLQK